MLKRKPSPNPSTQSSTQVSMEEFELRRLMRQRQALLNVIRALEEYVLVRGSAQLGPDLAAELPLERLPNGQAKLRLVEGAARKRQLA